MKIKHENCWYNDVCINKQNNEDCNNHCIRFVSMNSLVDQSGMPINLSYAPTLYALEENLTSFEFLAEWKENIITHINDGDNLYIYSRQSGTGKTTWACKIMMKYFDKIWDRCGLNCKGLFISVPQFLLKSKSQFNTNNNFNTGFSELVNKMQTVKLLIWDDIGMIGKLTEYEQTVIQAILDVRLNNGLSNIYTSNLTGIDLKEELPGRLFSRIWNSSKHVQLFGKDWRLEQ